MDTNKNFQIGDTVVIQIPETNSKAIGKIEEIFQQGKEKVIRYNEFYFPKKTSAGILPHNSKYELYKTDEIEKEFYSNIIEKCEVLKFDQYIKRILLLKEKKSESNLEKVFFVRQKYNPQDDIFTPDLSSSCYCDQIFNPDEIFIQCRECKELIHVNCFLSGETKKCFNASCNNNLENQLSQSNREQTTQGDVKILKEKGKFVGNKRNREEIQSDLAIELKLKKDEKYVDIPLAINVIPESNLKKIEERTKVPNLEEEKALNSYPNLSESRRKNLLNMIDNLEKKNSVNKPSTQDEKSRKNIRDKISYQLLYGIEEIKEYNDYSKMKNGELNRPEIEESSAIKICNNLAVAIESAIFLHNNESINQNYKKKFQILFPNLSDFRNYELRLAILNNDITPAELVKMSSEELAPTSLKKRRIERQEKYFKEQVLMKEEAKIIAKTHKGEAILTVDKDNSTDDYFLTAEVLQKNEEKYKNKDNSKLIREKDENISDKGSWIYDSDIEEKKEADEKLNKLSRENSSVSANKTIPQPPKNSKTKSNSHLPQKISDNKGEMKYKNLSKDMRNFYNILQEYKKENLLLKFNDKLKSNLRLETFNEILKRREEDKK